MNRLPVGGRFIDAGAHFGHFSLAAAAAVGSSGTVIAIEPTPSSASALRRNVAENEFEEIVTVIEGGASDKPGTGSLVVSDISEMFNTLELNTLDSTSGTLRIDLVTVDSVVESAGWPDIHLVKMWMSRLTNGAFSAGQSAHWNDSRTSRCSSRRPVRPKNASG